MYPSVPAVAAARAVNTGGSPHHFSSASCAAVVYGYVSMSTRPDPWGSGAVEIDTRNVILSGGPFKPYPSTACEKNMMRQAEHIIRI